MSSNSKLRLCCITTVALCGIAVMALSTQFLIPGGSPRVRSLVNHVAGREMWRDDSDATGQTLPARGSRDQRSNSIKPPPPVGKLPSEKKSRDGALRTPGQGKATASEPGEKKTSAKTADATPPPSGTKSADTPKKTGVFTKADYLKTPQASDADVFRTPQPNAKDESAPQPGLSFHPNSVDLPRLAMDEKNQTGYMHDPREYAEPHSICQYSCSEGDFRTSHTKLRGNMRRHGLFQYASRWMNWMFVLSSILTMQMLMFSGHVPLTTKRFKATSDDCPALAFDGIQKASTRTKIAPNGGGNVKILCTTYTHSKNHGDRIKTVPFPFSNQCFRRSFPHVVRAL